MGENIYKFITLSSFSGNGGSRKESPSKRVSFMPPVESREEGEEEVEEDEESEQDEKEESVDREEQDPNVSPFLLSSPFPDSCPH